MTGGNRTTRPRTWAIAPTAMNKDTLIHGLLLLSLAAPLQARQAQSLAAWWSFRETGGTTVGDETGHGFIATLQGGVTLGQPGGFPGTGFAARFDAGLAGVGVVANQAPLASMVDDLSVCAWVFVTANGAPWPRRIFGGDNSAWSCGLLQNGLRFTTRGIQDYDLVTSVPMGPWVHIAFVFDAQHDVTFYIDGNPVGLVTGSQPSGPISGLTGQWLLGAFRPGTEHWHGQIDDIQVYEGSLSPQEVAFLFQFPGSSLVLGGGTPYCLGDGTAGACPCGNPGAPGEGCANSTGQGGLLSTTGTASVAADDLQFSAMRLPPSQGAILFAGQNSLAGGTGLVFGDGLRCAGGAVRRLGIRVADSAGRAAWGPGLALSGGFLPGQTRRFQVWYKDPQPSPCGAGFNLTGAMEFSFSQ
jgi:hypothetical protein